MKNSKFCIAVLIFLFFILHFNCYAADTLTITTYYPSPYGSYQELRAQRMAIGTTWFNPANFPWNTGGGGLCAANEICNADLVVEGNVGIGTKSPAGIVEIANDGEASSWKNIVSKKYIDNQNAPNVVFLKARGSASSPTDVLNGDGLGRIHFSGLESGNWLVGENLNSWAQIDVEVDGVPAFDSHPSRITFNTTPEGSITNQDRMVIKNNGNVGIGTASPLTTTKLDVNGNFAVTEHSSGDGGIFMGYISSLGGGAINVFSPDGATYNPLKIAATNFSVYSGAAGITLGLYVDNNGNVGIGTASPGTKLHVDGGTISITGAGSPATGGALCLNASGNISKCTSNVNGSGNCDCPP